MRKMSLVLITVILSVVIVVPVFSAGNREEGQDVKKVAVVTPYMANATTAYVIEQFKSRASEQGWEVNVSDTAGDFGLLVSRIEDAIAQNVDAIVLGMGDPAQMTKGLKSAQDAGIPVFGLDAGLVEGVILNVTSDNADLGRQSAKLLAEAIGGKGDVIMYTHDPHPGVRARAVGAEEIFDSYSDITVVNKFHIDVPSPVDNARKITEDVLIGDSTNRAIAGIWAGWDEPALGTTQALEAAERTEVKVVGIDGTDFAKAEIDKGGPFVGTVEQDFDAMAFKLVELIDSYFTGDVPEDGKYQIAGTPYMK